MYKSMLIIAEDEGSQRERSVIRMRVCIHKRV